jgi:organic radical activating enzyme
MKHFSSYQPEYYSCPWIEGGLVFFPQSLHACCIAHHDGRGWPVLVEKFAGESLPLEEILVGRQNLIVSNQKPEHDPACRGCSFLQKRRWKPKKFLFDHLNFSHFTRCNLKCTYCWSTQPGFVHVTENVNLVPFLKMMIEKGLLARHSSVLWGGGEPTILPEFESMFSLLANHGAFQTLNTNAVLKSKVILQWLPVSRFKVVVSIDAGTPETYQKIKGANAFAKVWANVREYAHIGRQRVFVKYLFDDHNCSEVDFFIDQINKAKIAMVFADVDGRINPIPQEIIEAAGLLSYELRRRGIWFGAMGVGANAHPGQLWPQKVAAVHRRLSREKQSNSAISEWVGLGKQMCNSLSAFWFAGYDPATVRQNILSTFANIVG